MPQLFSALRVLGRHTVMKSALVTVGVQPGGHRSRPLFSIGQDAAIPAALSPIHDSKREHHTSPATMEDKIELLSARSSRECLLSRYGVSELVFGLGR